VPRELEAAALSTALMKKLGPPPFLRDFVRGRASEVVLVRDYSQQEFRILAHYEAGPLLAAYQADPHLDMHEHARQLVNSRLGTAYGRKPIKNLGFGILYGMGLDKLGNSMGVAREVAQTLRAAYKALAPGILRLETELKRRAGQGQPIRTLGGRLYLVEPPKLVNDVYRSFEYKLLNTLIQGSAADMTKDAMLAYEADPKRVGQLVLSVHDELVVVVPRAAAKEELARLRAAMEGVPLDAPLLSDGKMGQSWGSAQPVKEVPWSA
jgi:DNA polymerase-1